VAPSSAVAQRVRWVVIVLQLTTACGGLVETRSTDEGGFAGGAGSGAVPPVGGASGTSGSGGSGGSAGFATCGRAVCAPADLPPASGQLSGCCPDPSSTRAPGAGCGVDTQALNALGANFYPSCQAREQPGARDPACLETVIFPFDGDVQSFSPCCRTDVGICGLDVRRMGRARRAFVLPLGCVSATLSPDPRPVTICGQAPRPHHLSCACADGSKHEFCLAAGCGAFSEQNSVCAQACGGWDNQVEAYCSDDAPRCR
jgi:hypothetical protein